MVRRIPAVSYEVECLLLSGCAGVVPLPTHTETPPHGTDQTESRRKFRNSKEEVLAKLQPVNSGINGVRLFLARCSSSNKGGFALLCGYISCLGGGSRLWKTSNALLEFDEHDLLQRYSVFGDNILVTKLSPLRAKTQLIYGRDFFQRPG